MIVALGLGEAVLAGRGERASPGKHAALILLLSGLAIPAWAVGHALRNRRENARSKLQTDPSQRCGEFPSETGPGQILRRHEIDHRARMVHGHYRMRRPESSIAGEAAEDLIDRG